MSPVAQSVGKLFTDPGVVSPIPVHTFVEIDRALLSTSVLLVPLIQEELLSVKSKRTVGNMSRGMRFPTI